MPVGDGVDWKNGGGLVGGRSLVAGSEKGRGLGRRWAGQTERRGGSRARRKGSRGREWVSEVEARHRDTGSPGRGAGPEVQRSFREDKGHLVRNHEQLSRNHHQAAVAAAYD